MAKKSMLLLALDAEKGRDYEAEKKKKEVKNAEKRKRQKASAAERDGDADEVADARPTKVAKTSKATTNNKRNKSKPEGDDFAAFSNDEADNGSEAEKDAITTNGVSTIPQPTEDNEPSASEAEQESDVPLSDLEEEDLEDTIPHQRLTINNGPALLASRNRVAVVPSKASSKLAFSAHNSLVSPLPPSSTAIPDPNDDLTRELEFYRIAKEGALSARTLLLKEKIPFTRPSDYFAEMVKSDEHMGRVKKKMYDEAAGKKAAQEARKQRDAKKFGKAVQMSKEQERAKVKRETLDKIKELRKRKLPPMLAMWQETSILTCRNRTKGRRHRQNARSWWRRHVRRDWRRKRTEAR